jgi:hypothetical protein
MDDRNEARLLLAILREDFDAARRIVAERAADPDRFVALARACDVHPSIHALLESHGRFDLVGAAIEAALGALRRKVRADNLLLLARLEQGLDCLASAGITPVALKGVDTLHRLWNRFDERTLDDVDLLVHPRDLDRAIGALEGAGWSLPPGTDRNHWMRSSFELPLSSPGPIAVLFEIHWSLGQAERYAIRVDDALDAAVPLEIAGRRVLRLDDVTAAAHLLLHHLQHYFDRRLKWILDLRRMSRGDGFAWPRVAETLRSWGGSAAAGAALVHFDRLFPGEIPRQALRLLPMSAWRRAATWPLRSAHPLDLFRWTRSRRVQLYLAAVFLESPLDLPRYVLHRATRDRRRDVSPRGGQALP